MSMIVEKVLGEFKCKAEKHGKRWGEEDVVTKGILREGKETPPQGGKHKGNGVEKLESK